MGAAVDAVDHGVGGALQLVIKTAIDQSADHGRIEAFGREHIARRAAFDAAIRQSPVHAFDDVAALAEFTQSRLGLRVDRPLTGADLLGEAECFQLAEPSDLQRMKFVEPDVRIDRRLDDARGMAIADKLAVKLREALGIDLAFQAALDVEVGARP